MIAIAIYLSLLDFDWDEAMMICTGLAAATLVYMDQRREGRHVEVLRDHAERLSRLEVNNDDSVALEARMAGLEASAAVSERHDERIAMTQERIARLEQRWEDHESDD